MSIVFDSNNNFFYSQRFPTLKFISTVKLTMEEIRSRIKTIMDNVERHKEAMELVETVLRKGPVTVEFSLHETMMAGASWDEDDRKIEIDFSIEQASDLIVSFIFEMCNADNIELNKIEDDMFEDEEEYATKVEMAEYNTSHRCAQIVAAGRANFGWPGSQKEAEDVRKRSLEKWLMDVREPRLGYRMFSHYENYVYEHIKGKLLFYLSQKLRIAKKSVEKAEHQKLIVDHKVTLDLFSLRISRETRKEIEQEMKTKGGEITKLDSEIHNMELAIQKMDERRFVFLRDKMISIQNVANNRLLEEKKKAEEALKAIQGSNRSLEERCNRMLERSNRTCIILQRYSNIVEAEKSGYEELVKLFQATHKAHNDCNEWSDDEVNLLEKTINEIETRANQPNCFSHAITMLYNLCAGRCRRRTPVGIVRNVSPH